VVPPALALLPMAVRARLRVAHQARAEDHGRVAAFYEAEDIRAEVRPFFDDVPQRLAEAQLVIARAGASTLADLAVIGRPAILIPLATAIADEQTANARGPAAAGAAVLLPERGLTPEALAAEAGAILSDGARALAMSLAALALGRPDAAERLADLAEEVAGMMKEGA
jgi:UDP-N-acetylglucosamine--N-acetylmuramyl-(pentapeptide) pyrophosphoryl-undecaprenol N-acetylglucosamine transferase